MAVRPGSFLDAAKSRTIAGAVKVRLQSQGSTFILADPVPADLRSLDPQVTFYWGSIEYRNEPRAATVALSDDGVFIVAVSLPHACVGSRRTDIERAVQPAMGYFPREIRSFDEDLEQLNDLAILMAKWVRGELGPTPPLPPTA
jgi:hypothetical protein